MKYIKVLFLFYYLQVVKIVKFIKSYLFLFSMALENLTGRLAETYPKFDPNSIQHSDEITNDRRADKSLRDTWFWTADFPLYRVEDDEVMLYLARRENNLIFQNIKEATKQLIEENNYFPKEQDIGAVVNTENTLRINLSDLNLKRYDNEWCYFEIDSKKYDKLNKMQRAVAERVYGQGNNFIENMKMFKDSGINTTRIYVLNPDYVKKQNKPVARVCGLGLFGYDARFSADVRNVDYPDDALRGVRNVAEGDEKIEVEKAYEVLLSKPEESVKKMTPEIATGISNLLTNYLKQNQ